MISAIEKIEKVQVLDSNGSLVLEKRFALFHSSVALRLPGLTKGIYIVRVFGGATSQQ